MRRIFKWVGIAAAVLLAVIFALPFLINVNQFKPMLESRLSTALNREVKLGNLHLSLLSGEVGADDLSVSEDQAFGKPAFVHAKSLGVGAEIWPFLLHRKLVVTYLTIDQPEIALVQAPTGDWNFSSLGGARKPAAAPAAPAADSTPLDLSVKLVKITNGQVRMGRTVGHWKPLVLQQVNLELRDFSDQTAFPFTLTAKVAGGGSVELNGKAGPINPADSAMTPVTASLKVNQLDLAGSGAADFAPDMAGLISLDADTSSDGRTVQANGKLKAEKVKLSQKGTPASRTLEFDFGVEHDLRSHRGSLRRGDIHIGAAVARLTGTYAEQGDAMALNMSLAGPSMPVSELASLLPALGVALPRGSKLEGGTASVNLSMQGPADRLVTSGSLSLNNTKLTGFDLPKKMTVIEKLAGIKGSPDTEIQTLSTDVRVSPEGTRADNMKLIVPSLGDVTGAGTVNAANDLDFKMSATVHAIGATPIPFTVEGSCADPVFRPDMKAVGREAIEGIVGGDVKKQAGGLLKGLLGRKKN